LTSLGKVALITGASSGIGQALARQLAREGTTVGLLARRRDLLEELAVEIRDHGGNALPLIADVRDRHAVHAAAAQAERDLGPIDLLIANAGVGHSIPAASFDATLFDDTIATNLMGAAYAIEAVLPSMLRRGAGRVVGISSLAAYRGFPQTHAYCASKAALNTFLEGLRAEIAPRGIAVTTVCPGFVRTAMTAKNKHPMPFLLEPEAAAQRILKAVRAGRRVYNFPLPVAALVKLLRWVPAALVDRALRSSQGFDL
jgi:short-subunit dehydrogenase